MNINYNRKLNQNYPYIHINININDDEYMKLVDIDIMDVVIDFFKSEYNIEPYINKDKRVVGHNDPIYFVVLKSRLGECLIQWNDKTTNNIYNDIGFGKFIKQKIENKLINYI